ncbi:MAG: hypothetical protein N2Z65_01160 [Clostridiales bacterium]|nr:hypothetical protein [Clostridiales bacterium]
MKKKFLETIFFICRFIARHLTPRYDVRLSEKIDGPAVFIVHHQNLFGPVTSMIWFPLHLRPWILGAFYKIKTCFHQYYDYTFTKRFGMPKAFAAFAAVFVSLLVPVFVPVVKGIPVFRCSRGIVKTYRYSLAALMDGDNLLICPDIDYTDSSPDMGKMYHGFLDLEKYYIKETGRHLAFVPLHISKKARCIYAGRAIYYANNNFRQEKEETFQRLIQEFQRLEKDIEEIENVHSRK